jgi:hypothetical protein
MCLSSCYILEKTVSALNSGKIEIVYTGNKNILAFIRSFEEEKLLVLINFCNSKVTVNINLPVKGSGVFLPK